MHINVNVEERVLSGEQRSCTPEDTNALLAVELHNLDDDVSGARIQSSGHWRVRATLKVNEVRF